MRQLSFLADAQVPATRRVTEPIVRSALIEGNYRFWLKRAWGSGQLICWIMCNPSVADAAKDDPTMLRVMEFSAAWGYGSCVVVNVLPIISPSPADALEWMKRAEYWMIEGDPPTPEWEGYRQNLAHVSQQIDAASAHIVAWGNNIPPDLARRFLQDIAEMSGDGECDTDLPPVKFLCLGTTNSGAPKHPLARGAHRVPNDAKPISWKQK